MTKPVVHFKSQEERLNFLKGGYEEIIPKVAEKKAEKAKKAEKSAKTEKKSPKSTSKPKKTTKKGVKKDEVSAE